ncbi:WD40 repeat protein [Spirosoma lacussanchae]|uniref:WD40 repeat domain-containing protein n=1 Tax=Spirosoma lacussanchae TaxID=1884249 RepID=UPI001107FED2|nr:hypothetical protein [Spirosoma lacussanchae]
MNRYLFGALLLWFSTVNYAQKPTLFVPIGHTGSISSMAFSPTGHYAISGSYDKTIRLWEVATGRELHRFDGHTDDIPSVAFSPDGRYFFSGGSLKDNSIRQWSLTTGQEIRRFTDTKKFSSRQRPDQNVRRGH